MSVLKNQFEGVGGWGGSELSDQSLDPDVPTLASQDKLKVSPKGLPFVTNDQPHSALTGNLQTYTNMTGSTAPNLRLTSPHPSFLSSKIKTDHKIRRMGSQRLVSGCQVDSRRMSTTSFFAGNKHAPTQLISDQAKKKQRQVKSESKQ